jgi:DNA transposition AAA+ family ATPase
MQTGQQAPKPRPDRPFWPGAGRGDIVDQLSKALLQAGAVVVLTGAAAMGKTRLALEATARVEAASIPCRTGAGSRYAELAAIMDEIAKLPEQGPNDTKPRALLMVDQAEDAGAWTLEQLILIAGQTSIALMLVGRAELVGMLVRSVPEQVCDAITRYVALEPLDAGQAAEFVTHCLAAEPAPLICGNDALRRIIAHSHGVPGTIDRLMTDAQRLARLSRNARLTATVIDMIADDETPPVKELHR